MYKVRFHLGAGKNFRHWQIRHPGGVEYFNPAEVQLVLVNCRLRSNLRAAKRVQERQVRAVCGWVECEWFTSFDTASVAVHGLPRACYDPKVDPFWRIGGDPTPHDGLRLASLVSNGSGLHVLLQ